MSNKKRDVLSLLLPMFSGSKDEFGKEIVPPVPLGYHRVNENRPPLDSSARSILFRFPTELLSTIIELLPGESLASFALVSWDCRQLARSRQFVSVHLDYGNSSLGLLSVLLTEGQERLNNNGRTTSPSLGACIRRLVVATNPSWLSQRHGIALDDTFMNLEQSVRNQREAETSTAFYDKYIPSIQVAIAAALPHLELIDWEDKIAVSASFFACLSRSSVKHLKLFRVGIDEEFDFELFASLWSQGWPLRTLHLELMSQIYDSPDDSPTRIGHRILSACAPTLESLTWIGDFNRTPSQVTNPQSALAGHLGHLRFPRLSVLYLEYSAHSDSRILSALLGVESECRLRVLHANTEYDEMTSLCFKNRGTIHSLETFIWTPRQLADHSLGFLRNNTQLSKLDIFFATSPVLLEEHVLPLLSGSFSRLKSLRLVWDDTSIPDSALELISSLQSLEQICLCAGHQFGWRHDWLIDHDAMRRNLAKLTKLRKIAFPRDSYPTAYGLEEVESYYEIRMPRLEEFLASMEDMSLREIWENQHRQMILAEAEKYIRILPKLEWLYFGQLPMGVRERCNEPGGGNDGLREGSNRSDEKNELSNDQDSELDQGNDGSDRQTERSVDGKRMAIILSEERDDCCTLLRRIFGAEGCLFEA